MGELRALRHINIGQMIRLTDWTALLTVPNLESLELLNKLTPDEDVLSALSQRSTFKTFLWSAPDEADRNVERAINAAGRPWPPDNVRIHTLWQG